MCQSPVRGLEPALRIGTGQVRMPSERRDCAGISAGPRAVRARSWRRGFGDGQRPNPRHQRLQEPPRNRSVSAPSHTRRHLWSSCHPLPDSLKSATKPVGGGIDQVVRARLQIWLPRLVFVGSSGIFQRVVRFVGNKCAGLIFHCRKVANYPPIVFFPKKQHRLV
jgi:hypothetical protein